jgi:energy-coupling factor transporter ATP-binding protein EcfA2
MWRKRIWLQARSGGDDSAVIRIWPLKLDEQNQSLHRLLTTRAQHVRRFFKRADDERRQIRFEFPPFPGELTEILWARQSGKCAYCETKTVSSRGRVGRFRPEANAEAFGTSEITPDAYWWLAYDTANLLFSCATCEANKRNFFPVEHGKRLLAPGQPAVQERALLVCPYDFHPASHLRFLANGTVAGKTGRGEVTIALLQLNREDLIAARKQAIQHYRAKRFQITDEHEYAGALRDCQGKPKTQPSRRPLSPKRIKSWDTDRRDIFQYIRSIELRNFRSIDQLTVNLWPESGESIGHWKVVLGENAAGKSTILKALAMVLMGQRHLESLDLKPADILRRYRRKDKIVQATSGHIRVKFLNGLTNSIEFDRKGLRFVNGSHGMRGTIRAYGAMRLLPETAATEPHKQQPADVTNLFKPRESLLDVEQWMLHLYKTQEGQFHEFAKHVKYLLRLDDPKHEIEVRDNRVWLPVNGVPTLISELSDGFQSMVALAVDLMNGFEHAMGYETLPGILILDELGTHLHPRWRMEFVSRLRRTFQGLQVIATTHEPLCLRGLKKGEVALLRRTDGKLELVDDELPDIEGMRADQLLTSPLFGLYSTIDPEIEAKFVRYYDLLARSASLTPTEDLQRTELQRELKAHRHLAYTRRDQVLYELIDQYLAAESTIPHHKRKSLKQKTMRNLKRIWEELPA